MRILYFANPCSPHDTKWINRLAKNHTVEIVCQDDITNGVLSQEEIKIHSILPLFRTFRFKRTNAIKHLRKIISDFRPDVIHSMYMIPSSFWANEVKDNIPHVITTRGSDVLVEYPGNYFGINSSSKKIVHKVFDQKVRDALKKADYITCTSTTQAKVICSITKTEYKVIPTGVDIEKINYFRTKKENSAIYKVFCPRYMKPIYNIDKIVEAFHQFISEFPESELTLIDENNAYASTVKKLVANLNLGSKVTFVPKLNLEELIKRYCDSDLTIMIPDSDGTPNTALESMLCETPLIIGSADYNKNLFSTEWLWKIEQNNAVALLEQMLKVKKTRTEEINKKLKMGSEIVKVNASLEDSVNLIALIYEKVK
ncbi:MAG: hypothetical protein ACI9J3_000251 [Parvicellaceae bacterium]|jgi:hypothetical protein